MNKRGFTLLEALIAVAFFVTIGMVLYAAATGISGQGPYAGGAPNSHDLLRVQKWPTGEYYYVNEDELTRLVRAARRAWDGAPAGRAEAGR